MKKKEVIMEIFSYDSLNKQLELNEPEILLVREFKALLTRDKTKTKSRALKRIIYLAICWKSIINIQNQKDTRRH